MDDRQPTVDAGSRSQGLSPAEFEQALRKATAFSQRHGFGPRSAKIRDLRRFLGGSVSREAFDDGLRRLQNEGIVELAPHGHPELLTLSDVREALQEGASVLYLLRWLE